MDGVCVVGVCAEGDVFLDEEGSVVDVYELVGGIG